MAAEMTPLHVRCYFVGAGPGDPRLITVRGRDLLQRADAVLYDSLVNPLLLLECRKDALLEYVGKRFGIESTPQEQINVSILELLRQGKSVVRLKGGDPLTFARGAEEMQAVAAAGFEFEIVPGVSALNGCSAYAGIPLTHREHNSEFHAFTATRDSRAMDFSRLARLDGTRILFMGVSQLKKCCEEMLANCADPTTPVAIVEWGTRGRQRCVTGDLSTITQIALERKISQPALIIMGSTVSLRSSLAWWEKKPLQGKKILFTSSVSDSANRIVEKLLDIGAEVSWVPLVEIEPSGKIASAGELADLHRQPQTNILFTSANAVSIYLQHLLSHQLDARIFSGNTIIACGVPTKHRLADFGLCADISFPAGKLEHVAQHLAKLAGLLLWPCGSESQQQWLPGLEGRIQRIVVYNTTMRILAERERESIFENRDYTLFMSPSAVRSWIENHLPPELAGKPVAIGNRTAQELNKHRFSDIFVSENASAQSIISLLCNLCM
jgi:uroporphyrinogen III methyltransferase/synthase